MKIELPFPPSTLGPNNRSCWQKKARVFKKYKNDCIALMLNARKELAGRTKFEIAFRPPTAAHHDRDNLISRFKAGQDALAHVSGVNDRHFTVTYSFHAPVKGGAVIVEAA